MKILLKAFLIIITFQTFAIAACDVKAKFGDKKEVLEKKEFIGRPFPLEYVGLEVYPVLANDVCPNEKLDDIGIEYRFLYDELIAINFNKHVIISNKDSQEKVFNNIGDWISKH